MVVITRGYPSLLLGNPWTPLKKCEFQDFPWLKLYLKGWFSNLNHVWLHGLWMVFHQSRLITIAYIFFLAIYNYIIIIIDHGQPCLTIINHWMPLVPLRSSRPSFQCWGKRCIWILPGGPVGPSSPNQPVTAGHMATEYTAYISITIGWRLLVINLRYVGIGWFIHVTDHDYRLARLLHI